MSSNINYTQYINSKEWEAKKEEYFKVNPRQCSKCGATKNLHVHHLTYKRLGKEKLEDLTCLCHSCHDKEHQDKIKQKLTHVDATGNFKVSPKKRGRCSRCGSSGYGHYMMPLNTGRACFICLACEPTVKLKKNKAEPKPTAKEKRVAKQLKREEKALAQPLAKSNKEPEVKPKVEPKVKAQIPPSLTSTKESKTKKKKRTKQWLAENDRPRRKPSLEYRSEPKKVAANGTKYIMRKSKGEENA